MINVSFDRRTGRGFGEVMTSRGVALVQHDAHGLTVGLAEPGFVSEVFEGRATYEAWAAACAVAVAEARTIVEASPLRRGRIPALYLFGGPATGGMRWVTRGTSVPVCFATRRELLNALGREEIPLGTRVSVALEILERPTDTAAEERATFRWNRAVGRALWACPGSILWHEAQRAGGARRLAPHVLAEGAQGEVVEADRVGARHFLARVGGAA